MEQLSERGPRSQCTIFWPSHPNGPNSNPMHLCQNPVGLNVAMAFSSPRKKKKRKRQRITWNIYSFLPAPVAGVPKKEIFTSPISRSFRNKHAQIIWNYLGK